MIRFTNLISKLINTLETVVTRSLGVSNRRRWRNTKSLSETWDSRTRLIASIIPERATGLIEFGAGRMLLAELLPESCKYTPSDIIKRSSETLVVDLNASILPFFTTHDVAVFSGVLEYVLDIPRLVSHLSKSVEIFIVSYAPTNNFPNTLERRKHGWVNDYSINQLNEVFEQFNFVVDFSTTWKDQIIIKYVYVKRVD